MVTLNIMHKAHCYILGMSNMSNHGACAVRHRDILNEEMTSEYSQTPVFMCLQI